MTIGGNDIIDEAIAWHLRQSTMDEQGWLDLTDWLGAAPEHATAFDRVSCLDRKVVELLAQDRAEPVLVAPRFPQRRLWAIGGGMIAAAASVALVVGVQPRGASPYSIATAPGERQQVALADGTKIELNGGTRIELDRNNPREVKIAQGEAMFNVHHSSVPFRVHAGDLSIEDVGTVFNVARSAKRLDVQVAEGAVRFDPNGAAVLVKQGGALSVRTDTDEVLLSKVDADGVGGWRTGRLSFHGESVSSMLESITRQTGTKLSADAELSARPFTGMITLSGDAKRDVPHVAALIGASWRHDGEGWALSSGGVDHR